MWVVQIVLSTPSEFTDDKPFRERSHRLAPADVEDVRKSLNNLKSSGIISESRSPLCISYCGGEEK
jgi:hypothetical protein